MQQITLKNEGVIQAEKRKNSPHLALKTRSSLAKPAIISALFHPYFSQNLLAQREISKENLGLILLLAPH